MSDLRELYEETILDHGRNPRNHRALREGSRAVGHNPMCGDRVEVWVRVAGGVVEDASFEGTGCAIVTASASMMTEALRGRPLSEVEGLARRFHDFLTSPVSDATGLGKLEVFGGVRRFPARVKCASLPWHALRAALGSSPLAARTE